MQNRLFLLYYPLEKGLTSGEMCIRDRDEGTLDTLTGVGGSYWKYIQEGDLSYKLMFGPEGSCFESVSYTHLNVRQQSGQSTLYPLKER